MSFNLFEIDLTVSKSSLGASKLIVTIPVLVSTLDIYAFSLYI